MVETRVQPAARRSHEQKLDVVTPTCEHPRDADEEMAIIASNDAGAREARASKNAAASEARATNDDAAIATTPPQKVPRQGCQCRQSWMNY